MTEYDVGSAASLPSRPPVVGWFKAYAWFMTAVYVICAVGGVAILMIGPSPHSNVDPVEAKIQGIVMIAVGVVLMVAFAVAAVLPPSKGAWIYSLVMICLTMTSCCCLPMAIPLLLFWLKPDAKAYFGVT